MFWKRREGPEPFGYAYQGPCQKCGESLTVIMPWFRNKQVIVTCKVCKVKQELYPNRTMWVDTVKNGRDTE